MEYRINDYNTKNQSMNYDLCNYRELYSKVSSAERFYDNIIKYIPNTTHTGNYIHSN